ADCQAKNIHITAAGKSRFEAQRNSYTLPAPGRHHIYNALACISCARLLKVPVDAVQRSLKKARPDHNRGSLLRSQGRWIMDDSYNANPLSFHRALEVLVGFTPAKRRIVVCGDMRELGHASEKLHRALGKEMALRKIEMVLTVGEEARAVQQSFQEHAPAALSWHCPTRGQLHRRLRNVIRTGDVILVKGSRSMRMEKTVDYIKNQPI
ncbi:MAG: hypothetical protein K8I00_04910, partial [Candidatus Omnitrophica bacterium]|nr:hypothetical protein [Candidatus Omnitrophota bacterium]